MVIVARVQGKVIWKFVMTSLDQKILFNFSHSEKLGCDTKTLYSNSLRWFKFLTIKVETVKAISNGTKFT